MELFRALAVMCEPPDRAGAERVAHALGLGPPPHISDFTETFVFQLYPYASVYLGAEGMLGGEARDRVAGFWRALGETPPPEPDHLPLLLALYAQLSEAAERAGSDARRASLRNAQRAFLWEHLLSWLPVYTGKLEETAPPFYRRWGEILSSALLEEARLLGAQKELPLALREAPALTDPRAGGEEAREFTSELLAPARCGMILTRADLARASRELKLGLRAGERRFSLRSLFDQDAARTLLWLAREADRQAARHARHIAALGAVALWWSERARNASALLRELAGEVEKSLRDFKTD